MLKHDNLPLYYGGTVRGSHEDEYEYIGAGHSEGQANYRLGAKLCAGLAARLEKTALRWWEDYDCSGNLEPNCWKKHVDNPRPVAGSVSDQVEEVALYDLLKKHFNTGMDT